MEFSTFVKERLEREESSKKTILCTNMRYKHDVMKNLNDDEIVAICKDCSSWRQSVISCKGSMFEKCIESMFLEEGIPFVKQVVIDHDGNIVSKGVQRRRQRCYHVVDFIIGDKLGSDKIEDFIVVSVKTTCRERWTQDDWTLKHYPKKYLLVTLSNDYPSSLRFKESEKRKILTMCPKKVDDRIYKLSLDDLMRELNIGGVESGCEKGGNVGHV